MLTSNGNKIQNTTGTAKLRTMLVRSLEVAALAILLAAAAPAFAQTGYTITGGMSNFDCGNHCDEPCDEFEVEIEDIFPEDVVHTYHNSNYGNPTVTLSPGGNSTIVDYRNPNHLTAVGSIEHFGITLRQLSAAGAIHVRWMVNGQSATVNGQVPLPGGGSAPATQPMLPSITADLAAGSTGGDGIACSVMNTDPFQFIWIKRRALVSQGVVTLESLMPNDPVVTTTVPLDASPVLLAPGQTLTVINDLIEVEDNESVVFTAEYFQDLGNVGPFGGNHVLGPMLGNVMTASIASPDSGCSVSSPIILEQPISTTADEGHSVDLRVNADGNDLTLSYQWLKEGLPIVEGGAGGNYHSVTSDELSIDELNAETEGFYAVRVTNLCGSVVSDSALVFITGHNDAPTRVCDPVAVTTFASEADCYNGYGYFLVNPTGTAPFTFQWEIQTDPETWLALDVDYVQLPCGGWAIADQPDAAETYIEVIPCDGVENYQVRCLVTNDCGSSPSALGQLTAYSGLPGDMNRDGLLNAEDIQSFVDAVLSTSNTASDLCIADVNMDLVLNVDDVPFFVDALLNQ
ncbi:MAG: immunoglobulin domain-containing protein [Phycisphaerales bacterium]|nr:immunoglobulin domain-containing protein [Phycisphaerales bacterium]MCB9864570.1 immunoglobulin domain-containing protein [Phycisphaerales bacterium]